MFSLFVATSWKSSAKPKASHLVTCRGRLITKMMNRSEPSNDPCGTPLVTCTVLELRSLSFTNIVLFYLSSLQ